MTVLLFLAWLLALLVVLGSCKVSGECAEQERRAGLHDPCETCLRWSECNGVDDECPLRKEVK